MHEFKATRCFHLKNIEFASTDDSNFEDYVIPYFDFDLEPLAHEPTTDGSNTYFRKIMMPASFRMP
jgi:hypothetical protein